MEVSIIICIVVLGAIGLTAIICQITEECQDRPVYIPIMNEV